MNRLFDMKINIHVIAILITISLLFTVLISIINDSIFIDPIRDVQFRELFSSGKINDKTYGKNIPIVELRVKWPIRSIVFFYGTSLLYWFFVGYVVSLKRNKFPVIILLLIPVVSNLINLDIMLPLYVLFYFLGRHFARHFWQ